MIEGPEELEAARQEVRGLRHGDPFVAYDLASEGTALREASEAGDNRHGTSFVRPAGNCATSA